MQSYCRTHDKKNGTCGALLHTILYKFDGMAATCKQVAVRLLACLDVVTIFIAEVEGAADRFCMSAASVTPARR